MRLLRVISVSFLIVLGILVIQSLAASDYECTHGVYRTLSDVTRECRLGSPSLRGLRKEQIHLSGYDIVDTFEEYCRNADAITGCVEQMIAFLPCLNGSLEYFQSMITKSNWVCNGTDVRDVIKDIFSGLPMQSLDYRENLCYREAPKKTYICVRRYLNKDDIDDERERQKKILSSFRCSFRKLSRVCPRDPALFFTTLEYDWLIIPPALGINISYHLIGAAEVDFN